jgi:hypothetical protein
LLAGKGDLLTTEDNDKRTPFHRAISQPTCLTVLLVSKPFLFLPPPTLPGNSAYFLLKMRSTPPKITSRTWLSQSTCH